MRVALSSSVTFSGWNKGAGITAASGNDALAYSQNMPALETDASSAARRPPERAGESRKTRLIETRNSECGTRKADIRVLRRRKSVPAFSGPGANQQLVKS